MECVNVPLPGGGFAIVCGRGMRRRVRRCRYCSNAATFLCDWKIEAMGTVHTCDRPMCFACACELGPEKHLCREHRAAYVAWLQRQGIVY